MLNVHGDETYMLKRRTSMSTAGECAYHKIFNHSVSLFYDNDFNLGLGLRSRAVHPFNYNNDGDIAIHVKLYSEFFIWENFHEFHESMVVREDFAFEVFTKTFNFTKNVV